MNIKEEIANILKEKVGEVEILFSRPLLEFGDLSTNVAMQTAKEKGKSPKEWAEEIAGSFSHPLVREVSVAGPGFINFTFSDSYYLDLLSGIDKGYGKGEWLLGEKWVVEHTSPNPNKAMHVGHLRNNIVGMNIGRILENFSAEVVYDMVDNNRGVAIAKLMWGYLKYGRKSGDAMVSVEYFASHQDEWMLPEDLGMDPGKMVDHFYVKGSEDFSNDEEVEKKVREMVVLWEGKDEDVWKLWEVVLNYSYLGQERVLKRLGNRWDFKWHEHEHYGEGKEYVEKGLSMGVFKELEDGAILTDLEKDYGLTDTVLKKKDGTSLYITQDIALTDLKIKKYSPDKLIWVIGSEQSLAMKQMFAVCDQLGIGSYDDFLHVAYGFVMLPGEDGGREKMSSRKGNTVFINDLLDTVKGRLREKLLETREEVSDEMLEKVALGAVKFSFSKVAKAQDMVFDIEKSIDLLGDSGPYLQYTYARCKSVLQKGGECSGVDFFEKNNVVKMLDQYPEVVLSAYEEMSGHPIANYLVMLAREFNSLYGEVKFISGDVKKTEFYLLLCEKVSVVIASGLYLLGIEVLEEM